MGLINYSSIEDGTTIDAADVNTPLTTIYNDYNGNINSNNLADNAVTTAKIGDDAVTADKTAFGGDYSTGEVNTGFTWVDAKTIYKKTVNFGALPNTTTKTVAHGITAVDSVINVTGVAKFTTGVFFPLPFAALTLPSQIQMFVDGTNISIATGSDRSSGSAYITIYYTKV